jgi:hypothetical protein
MWTLYRIPLFAYFSSAPSRWRLLAVKRLMAFVTNTFFEHCRLKSKWRQRGDIKLGNPGFVTSRTLRPSHSVGYSITETFIRGPL